MPTFHYIAVRDGLETRGVLEAETKGAVAQQLKEAGYTAVRVKRATGQTGLGFRRLFHRSS